MYSPLYLDTARIGLMTPEARQSCDDATALAMRDPVRAFQEFRSNGNSPVIRHWSGIHQLRNDILQQVAISTHNRLLTASNSASLLALASRCLFSLAENVMVTDLIWPNHLAGLEHERSRSSGEIAVARLRHAIIDGASIDSIISRIASKYTQYNCQAIYLTAVSSDGIRLPVDKIVSAISKVRPPRFIVVDGAQEFAHFDAVSSGPQVDLYMFGSHKWLGAYHPLSLATFGRFDSAAIILELLSRMTTVGEIKDPTLKCSLEERFEYRETISLLPFFSLAGAIKSKREHLLRSATRARFGNLRSLSKIVHGLGWKERLERLASEFKSAISIIEPRSTSQSPTTIQRRLGAANVSATVLPDGAIRTSMPTQPFTSVEKDRLTKALRSL